MIEAVRMYLRRLGKAVRPTGRKRLRRAVAMIRGSDLFDRSWYLETYSDVRESGAEPMRHYLVCGWREGRDPGPNFSTTAYLKANADVAALGVNPLLHYIEFGRTEGRGAPHQGSPPSVLVNPHESFGPAAPCAFFPSTPNGVTYWRRAGRIVCPEGKALSIGGVIVGTVSRTISHKQYDAALARLASLAGQVDEAPRRSRSTEGACLEIKDAWFAGGGILRVRWTKNSEMAVVVRAVQQVEQEPVIVGEALIEGELDVFDARLLNPFFPLLFLFANAEGEIQGLRHLCFPALCRGGLYYSELLASADSSSGSLDLASLDERLADRLLAIGNGRVQPLVKQLSVDVAGGDGTGPLFRPAFQSWLASVMRVPVCARRTAREEAASRYLAETVELASGPHRHGAGAELRLIHDMLPTISVLVAPGGSGGRDGVKGTLLGSLVEVPAEPALPATLVRVPARLNGDELIGLNDALPSLRSLNPENALGQEAGLLALKVSKSRPPTDGEFLVPVASPERPIDSKIDITWIISAKDWDEQPLQWSLEALAVQRGIQHLAFVGRPSTEIMNMASRLFGPNVEVSRNVRSASNRITTRLGGYLGPNIFLHDRSTVAKLIGSLEQPAAQTVSAPIVTVERRGKGWLIAPRRDSFLAAEHMLPGAVLPIAGPVTDFWIAHSEKIRSWAQPDVVAPLDGSHFLSLNASVSSLRREHEFSHPIVPPVARHNRAVSIELLVG